MPVVVDKPFAPNWQGAEDLIRAAAGRGVPLSVSRNGSIAVESLRLETSNYELGWVR
jgi:predicted dehydrogenase